VCGCGCEYAGDLLPKFDEANPIDFWQGKLHACIRTFVKILAPREILKITVTNKQLLTYIENLIAFFEIRNTFLIFF
jgi:hypothetical protein